MRIVEVDWGIANRFSDCIEVNRHLKKYPKLYNPIIQHELNHTDETFSWKDFRHDFTDSAKMSTWELTKFCIHHPKALLQFAPFYWTRKRGFIIDINLSIFYGFLLLIFGIAVFISLRFI